MPEDSRPTPDPHPSPAPAANPGPSRCRKVKNNRLASAGYTWAFAALTASPGARAHYDAPRLPDEESCKGTGGTREPPKARFPGSPGPPPALPPTPGRAPRAITDSHTAPSPATTETSNSAADTPAPRRPGQRGKGKAGHPSERFCPEHAVGAPQIQECPYEHQPTRTGPGANERLTRSANTRHAAGPNRSTGPGRSWVSRTSTRSLCPATSTQPPFEAL